MSMIPRPVSGALQVYLAQDGNLYAVNQVDGRSYQVSGLSAQPPASGPPASGGDAVQKAGDSMTGPLSIATATQPELKLSDAVSGPQTLSLNNSTLKLADSVAGNQVTISLAQVAVEGNGAGIGGSANRTTIGVNSLQLAHKSFATGTKPLSLSQSNQGELFIQNSDATVYEQVSDLANGHAIKISSDVGNRLSYGSDRKLFLAPGATFANGTASCALDINADGDLMITQQSGPNAGKSVNLTFGKWA